ncbi:MAG: HD domain-containing protein [Thiotrichaceae bacterium]
MWQLSENTGLLLKALSFAVEKHRQQRRKDLEASPYINHPIQVAETLWIIGGVRDAALIVAALLHDTLEDTRLRLLKLILLLRSNFKNSPRSHR